jgi:hypothetical protein
VSSCAGCGREVEDVGLSHCRSCRDGVPRTSGGRFAPRKLKRCHVCGEAFRARSGRQETCDGCRAAGRASGGSGVRVRSAAGVVARAGGDVEAMSRGDRVLALEARVAALEVDGEQFRRLCLLVRAAWGAIGDSAGLPRDGGRRRPVRGDGARMPSAGRPGAGA